MIEHVRITMALKMLARSINQYYDGYRAFVDVSGQIPQLVIKEE